MSRFKQQIKDYFSFTRSETIGISVLLCLIVIILILPYLYRYFRKEPKTDFSVFERQINEFENSIRNLNDTVDYNQFNKPAIESSLTLFEFDPNNLPFDEWKKLGLSDKQIKVIKNYEAKGGRFYKKEDLRKIYSISEEEYLKLEPYIIINSKTQIINSKQITNSKTQIKNFKKPHYDYKKDDFTVEINAADSFQLMRLRGIGSVFAKRIINYRKLLGGYNNKEQLMEVWGMDSDRFNNIKDKIIVNTDSVHKININNITFKKLLRHPYVKYDIAVAITNYKKLHGNFKDVSEIRGCTNISDSIFQKLIPYINVK